MTTVHSNTQPEVIAIDKIENGIARLLVRWNIRQVSVPDPMTGETREEWQYSERVIKWTIPQKYDTLADLQEYLEGIQNEIINWAEATEMNSTTIET
jgi:hypothetical protein